MFSIASSVSHAACGNAAPTGITNFAEIQSLRLLGEFSPASSGTKVKYMNL
jgi:hypothetical protein